MIKTIFLIFCISYTSQLFANQLKPFVTDNCTMFVDGTISKPTLWRHCCIEHDIRYWYGGSTINQDKADLDLKSCVKDVAGSYWATLIYTGVRAGHMSPVKSPYVWSWGWETKRDNKVLSTTENSYVQEELRRLPFDPLMIERFIQNNF
jgi:hypothetical protein